MPVSVDTNRLNRIIDNTPGNAQRLLKTIAFAIESGAKERAPVDTGALRNSIYTRIGNEGAMPAVPGTPKRVQLPNPPNENTAHIGPSVDYGADVELGGGNRTPRPYLTPAVRAVEQRLDLWREGARRIATDG